MTIQHLRSSTASKRPTPAAMADGQIAVNTNTASPGLFFKDSAGALIKVGPVHVGTTAPNASPASGGETGNTVGEQWLDTTGGTYVFKVWDGSAWRSETGTFVDVNGDTMTGALGIIAGSASTPGLFFSGDTNTGIYSPGADQLALSTNGTGRLFVDSAGVITTDSAITGSRFNIVNPNSVSTYDRLLAIRNGNLTTAFLGVGLDSFYVASASGSPMVFCTNSDGGVTGSSVPTNERLRITSAGLVGIGTSSVGDVLHVKGSSTYAGVIADNSAATGGGAFRAYRNGVQKAIFCADSWVTGTSSDDAAIYADAGGGIKFYTNNSSTAKAVLTSGGSLGIGTTDIPSDTNLAVLGNFQTGFYRNVTSGNRGYFVNIGAKTSTGFADGGYILGIVESGDSTGYLAFGTRTGGTATEKARIDSSGRLLVGTSTNSGGALLQVNGDRIRVGTAKTPASATDTGTAGEICWDANYIYVCTATNTWKRTAIATW